MTENKIPDGRRVVVFVPWLMGGGAQAALLGLLDQMSADEFAVVVVFRGSSGLDALRARGYLVVEWSFARNPLSLIFASRLAARAARGVDVVYSLMRGSHVVLGLRARTIRRRAKTVIATFHQLPSTDSPGARGRIEDALVRRFTQTADLVTAPSKRGLSEVVELGFAEAARARFEPNVIPRRSEPRKAARGGALREVRLVFAGRLTKQKGLDRLPELLKRATVPVHIKVLGEGPELDSLQSAATSIGNGHRVEFLGRQSGVFEYIDWADAAFMPSRQELNPVFVWEARERGRPLIASDIPAFVDLAADGGVVLFNSSEDFSDVVQRLAVDEDLRRQLADEALNCVPAADADSWILSEMRSK